MSDAGVVTPEVIEPTNEVIVQYTPSIIADNLASLDAWVDQQLEPYQGAEIDPADEKQVKAARKFMADLNKLKGPIDAERKRIKKEYSAPLNAFEARVKTITGKIDAARDGLKKQVDTADAAFRENRKADLEEEWLGCAGKLAGIIPFDAVLESSWLNRSTQWNKALNELYDKAQKAVEGYTTLDETELQFRDECVKTYCETLSLQAALDRERELKAEAERMAEFRRAEEEANERRRAIREAEEAARAAAQAEREAMIEQPVEPPAAPVEQPPAGEPAYRWELNMTFDGTRSLAQEVGSFLKSRGITGATIHCIGRA